MNGSTIHVHDPGDENDSIKLNLKEVDITEFDGIDGNDFPDFCDAFASEATYGERKMTEEELDILNDKHHDFVYERIMDLPFHNHLIRPNNR